MSTIVELFPRGMQATPIAREEKLASQVEPPGLPNEAIRVLIERLFFRSRQVSPRHVAFASSEEDAQTSELCYTAARILAQQVRGDVALVDASVDSLSLADRFNFAKGDGESQISERLWVVNRSAWIEAGREGAIDTGCVRRLREIASQFDFSIFSCEALNTVTTTLAGACDGLVLVLKANTTRRLVAKRLKEQLRNTDVPLLGTVLIGRRFPIPERIYRML